MRDIETGTGRRSQLSLRELLLWTLIVALCLGLSGDDEHNPIELLLLVCWCFAIAAVRRRFGRCRAAWAAVAGAVILMSFVYIVDSTFKPPDFAGAAIVGLLVGVPIGLMVFGLLELVSAVTNWFDQSINAVGERGSRKEVNWLVLGMLCGMALAFMKYPDPRLVYFHPGCRSYDASGLQQAASALYWYSLLGVAFGGILDVSQGPTRVRSFRYDLRTLLLIALSLASFLLGRYAHLRIVDLPCP